MNHFLKDKTAVITGAASGLGLALARHAAGLGMRLVLADVELEALNRCTQEFEQQGVQVLSARVDVAKSDDVAQMAQQTLSAFGVPHLVFNNAGVATGGLLWEASEQDWDWVLGVNLMGVVHGVRHFTPMMLQAAKKDARYSACIVNTASMAGLVCMPNMGVYNVSKHAVVALTETLCHELALVTQQVRAALLCPYFVPTGINSSERNRCEPDRAQTAPVTPSQLFGREMMDKAVRSGKVSAEKVAELVFEAIAQERFYIFSHPQAMQGVAQRFDDVLSGRSPSNPYAHAPHLEDLLRRAIGG